MFGIFSERIFSEARFRLISGADCNIDISGLFNTNILTAITPGSLKIEFNDLTAITPCTLKLRISENFWAQWGYFVKKKQNNGHFLLKAHRQWSDQKAFLSILKFNFFNSEFLGILSAWNRVRSGHICPPASTWQGRHSIPAKAADFSKKESAAFFKFKLRHRLARPNLTIRLLIIEPNY